MRLACPTTTTETRPATDPNLPLTENALCDTLADAPAGTAITYHIGLLARDRDRLASSLEPEQRDALDAVASRAWRLAAAGWVDLVQRRSGEERFVYLLVVRRRPLSARSARALAAAPLLLAEAA
jgi:hypothetical protein